MGNYYNDDHVTKGDWEYVYVSDKDDTYLIYYRKTGDRAFVLTGNDDDLEITPEFPYRLNRVELVFDDDTVKDIQVFKLPYIFPNQDYPLQLREFLNNIDKNMTMYFDMNDKSDMNDKLRLRINGTVSKKVWVIFTIQKLRR